MTDFGYEQYDSVGSVTMDGTYSVFRILGSINTGGSSGSITDPAFADGTFWFITWPEWDLSAARTDTPVVYLSGTTMYWSYASTTTLNTLIHYGIR